LKTGVALTDRPLIFFSTFEFIGRLGLFLSGLMASKAHATTLNELNLMFFIILAIPVEGSKARKRYIFRH
jgi:hypothetical protein